jgi:hypothetical protein
MIIGIESHFQQYYSDITALYFICRRNEVPVENHTRATNFYLTAVPCYVNGSNLYVLGVAVMIVSFDYDFK